MCVVESTINYIGVEDWNRIEEYLSGMCILSPREIGKYSKQDVAWRCLDLCYWSGCRISETLSFDIRNYDVGSGRLVIPKSKTGRKIKMVMPPGRLQMRLFVGACKEVNVMEPFDTIKYNTIYKWLKIIGAALDIPAWNRTDQRDEKTITHIMRKSAAKDVVRGTHMKDGRKGTISDAANILGHASVLSTERYIQERVERINDMFYKEDGSD